MLWIVGLLLLSAAALKAAQVIALIEMPPYGGEPVCQGPAPRVRMSGDREWLVQMPVEVRLNDGIVVSASTDLPALAESAEL